MLREMRPAEQVRLLSRLSHGPGDAGRKKGVWTRSRFDRSSDRGVHAELRPRMMFARVPLSPVLGPAPWEVCQDALDLLLEERSNMTLFELVNSRRAPSASGAWSCRSRIVQEEL